MATHTELYINTLGRLNLDGSTDKNLPYFVVEIWQPYISLRPRFLAHPVYVQLLLISNFMTASICSIKTPTLSQGPKLADFWLIFPFFERINVCAFISRKLNKLRGPFFIFPDNFTHSILIAKKYLTWGSRFGGYSAPKSVSEAKISKLTLFRAAPVTKRLDPEVQWWFYFVCQRVL